MSRFGLICKFFFRVTCIVLMLSLLRKALGVKPISFSFFLQCFSEIDVDFSSTVGRLASIASSFSIPSDVAWYEKLVSWLSGILNTLMLPVNLVVDFFQFVLSVCRFIIGLLGFDVFGISDPSTSQPPINPPPIKPWLPDFVTPM